jgi:hypothetical protein
MKGVRMSIHFTLLPVSVLRCAPSLGIFPPLLVVSGNSHTCEGHFHSNLLTFSRNVTIVAHPT